MKNKALVLGLLLLFSGFCQEKPSASNRKDEVGYVPNSETAVKIAEAVWLNIYGKSIYREKPFVAVLKDNTTWVVEGTLHTSRGGVAHAEIDKKTGAVANVTHGR